MSTPRITAHMLIKNEQRWVWFAIQSVLAHVDSLMVWDTGSMDRTMEVVKSIASPKIHFRQVPLTDAQSHSALRQQMIDETKTEWFLILDGDEVWWQDSIKEVVSAVKSHPEKAGIISPFINAVGDVFHYQDSKYVGYTIGKHSGAFTIRAINRRLPDLKLVNPHGRQEYQTRGVALQHLSSDDLLYVDKPFFHLTYLPRSGQRSQDQATLKRNFKYRHELGLRLPVDYEYPEVFYYPRPLEVPSPFSRRSTGFVIHAAALEPFRILKRVIRPSKSTGY